MDALLGDKEEEETQQEDGNVFELPFEPPDWQNSLGFFLPLPTPKAPIEVRPVEFLEIPDLPQMEKSKAVWKDLISLLGSGGASSRAISERMHRLRAGDGPAEEEELTSPGMPEDEGKVQDVQLSMLERKLTKSLKSEKTKVADAEKKIAKILGDKEAIADAKKELEDELEVLRAKLEDQPLTGRSSRSHRTMGSSPRPTGSSSPKAKGESPKLKGKDEFSTAGLSPEEKRKMLKKKANAMMKGI